MFLLEKCSSEDNIMKFVYLYGTSSTLDLNWSLGHSCKTQTGCQFSLEPELLSVWSSY